MFLFLKLLINGIVFPEIFAIFVAIILLPKICDKITKNIL